MRALEMINKSEHKIETAKSGPVAGQHEWNYRNRLDESEAKDRSTIQREPFKM